VGCRRYSHPEDARHQPGLHGHGWPYEYTGRDIKTTHARLGITDTEFDAVVDDLVKTLDKYKVPEREKNELLSLLAPMRKDIVEVK